MAKKKRSSKARRSGCIITVPSKCQSVRKISTKKVRTKLKTAVRKGGKVLRTCAMKTRSRLGVSLKRAWAICKAEKSHRRKENHQSTKPIDDYFDLGKAFKTSSIVQTHL